MTLLETDPGESAADFRAAADAMLQSLNPARPKWWHPYEVRGIYRYRGLLVREFHCVAGSVELWLRKLAAESSSRRVMVLPSAGTAVARVSMVGQGRDVPVNPSEVTAIAPA